MSKFADERRQLRDTISEILVRHHMPTRQVAIGEILEACEAQIQAAEKAYGGCHKCYGKGFSTWRHGETYWGTTHDIRTEMKYCSCDRGKQLEALVNRDLVEARKEEVERFREMFTSARAITVAANNRLARLSADNGETKHSPVVSKEEFDSFRSGQEDYDHGDR